MPYKDKARQANWQKLHRAANIEHITLVDAAWYKANKAHKAEMSAAWAAAHPGHKAANARAWNKNHSDRRWATEAAYRARKLDAFVEEIDRQVVFERDGGICQICLLPIDDDAKWHVDHIMPLVAGGEHSYANVQLAHATCNLRKGGRV